MLRRATALAFWTLLLAAAVGDAQSVRGRIVDAETGREVDAGTSVQLVNARGAVAAEAVSIASGFFRLLVHDPGAYTLRATHIGYRVTETEIVLRRGEELVIDLRLAVSAITLEPLTVTARRNDPRHDATREGMLARAALMPPIGNRRVVRSTDAEMESSATVTDMLSWFTLRPRCRVVFWNGSLIEHAEMAQSLLDDPLVRHLEAVEYYTFWSEAPQEFQQIPAYMRDVPSNCNVLALWPARGYVGFVGKDVPFRGRLSIGAAAQRITGRYAPDAAIASGAAFEWPFYKGLAATVHVRRAAPPLAAATIAELTAALGSGAAQPGERHVDVWSAAAGTQLYLWRHAPLRPAVAIRVLTAQRSFNPFRVPGARDVQSRGRGVGFSVGVERPVGHALSALAAFDYDRISFDAYGPLERPGFTTAATWTTAALRFGFGYAIVR
jgi:hypothetical protein